MGVLVLPGELVKYSAQIFAVSHIQSTFLPVSFLKEH